MIETTKTLVLIAHLLVALFIIGLVLLQRGKGAEAGTGFGAGASGTVFGSRGSASFFSRATAILATLFFATSLALAYFSTQAPRTESLIGAAPIEDAGTTVQDEPGAVDIPDAAATDAAATVESPAGVISPDSANGESADQ